MRTLPVSQDINNREKRMSHIHTMNLAPTEIADILTFLFKYSKDRKSENLHEQLLMLQSQNY